MTRSVLKPALCAGAGACLVAFGGAQLTELGPWYRGLAQPAWKPPDAAFGPAWTLLFILAAISAVLGWRHIPAGSRRALMVALFVLNGVFNLLWSLLFFHLQRPDWALAELPLLGLTLVLLMVVQWPHSRLAAALLAPYLAWVVFAGTINWGVIQLNGPF